MQTRSFSAFLIFFKVLFTKSNFFTFLCGYFAFFRILIADFYVTKLCFDLSQHWTLTRPLVLTSNDQIKNYLKRIIYLYFFARKAAHRSTTPPFWERKSLSFFLLALNSHDLWINTFLKNIFCCFFFSTSKIFQILSDFFCHWFVECNCRGYLSISCGLRVMHDFKKNHLCEWCNDNLVGPFVFADYSLSRFFTLRSPQLKEKQIEADDEMVQSNLIEDSTLKKLKSKMMVRNNLSWFLRLNRNALESRAGFD